MTMQTFQGDPNVDSNKVPQRTHKYPASDRARKIAHEEDLALIVQDGKVFKNIIE